MARLNRQQTPPRDRPPAARPRPSAAALPCTLLLAFCAAMANGAQAQVPGDNARERESQGALPPVGAVPHPTGLSRYGPHTRSPSGLHYPDVWQLPALRDLGEGNWQWHGSIEAGALVTGGGAGRASFLEYGDWDDGALLNRLHLQFENQVSGNYLRASANGAGRDDQSYHLAAGSYGRYELAGFVDAAPHTFSTDARILWQGAGSGRLTLPAGVPVGTATADAIRAAFTDIGSSTLALQRDRYGLSLRLTPSARSEWYAEASTERRDGRRSFGGSFAYPGLGQVMETVEPIDYTTTDLAAGFTYRGERNQFNLRYAGSIFRNDEPELQWENPGLSPFPAFAPPVGRVALPPDNDHQNLKAEYGRRLAFWSGRLTATVSYSRMRQDDDLLPTTISSGVLRAAGQPIDLDLWNTPAALSRQSADARIDQLLGHARLVLQPARNLRIKGELRVRDEDNDTDYVALNPLTGQYGYIALDGGLTGTFPQRSAVFDPDLPGSRVRIRNIPFEKDTLGAELGIDYRLHRNTRIALTLEREEFDYAHRERSEVHDDSVSINVVQTGIPRGSLRLGYRFTRRDGDEYTPNPYEPFYSSSLAGFTLRLPEGQVPHTLAALRKFDLASRDTHTVDANLLFVLSDAADLSLSGRFEQANLEADFGLRDAEELSLNVEWSRKLALNSELYLYYSYQRHRRTVGNINDAGPVGVDAAPGSAVFPLANAWSEHVAEDNHSVGGGFTRTFGSLALDLRYTFNRSESRFDYDFASPGAFLDLFPLAEVGSGFPQQSFELHTLQADLDWHLRDDLQLRFRYRFEKENLDDFHFAGLREPLAGNAIFLAAVPENFSANALGIFLQKTF